LSNTETYAIWTIAISLITLIVLVASVIAQYLGLFTGKIGIPKNAKVLIYTTDKDVIGGIVIGTTKDSVSLKKAYAVMEIFTIGSSDVQHYVTGKHFGESNIPTSSILRWKIFPKILSDQWDKLPEER